MVTSEEKEEEKVQNETFEDCIETNDIKGLFEGGGGVLYSLDFVTSS